MYSFKRRIVFDVHDIKTNAQGVNELGFDNKNNKMLIRQPALIECWLALHLDVLRLVSNSVDQLCDNN